MSPLTIVLGALGVVIIVVGLMSNRFGLPSAAKVGGIIVGVVLLVAAAAVMAMGSPEVDSTPDAAEESGTASSSTPTAAAVKAEESDSDSQSEAKGFTGRRAYRHTGKHR